MSATLSQQSLQQMLKSVDSKDEAEAEDSGQQHTEEAGKEADNKENADAEPTKM